MIRNYGKIACYVTAALIFFFPQQASSQRTDSVRLSVQVVEGEYWWIGIINHGSMMPLTQGYNANLHANLYGNQAQPLLLSSKGKVVWSDDAFIIKYEKNSLSCKKIRGIRFCKARNLLKRSISLRQRPLLPSIRKNT